MTHFQVLSYNLPKEFEKYGNFVRSWGVLAQVRTKYEAKFSMSGQLNKLIDKHV
jgi:hypothetical protein